MVSLDQAIQRIYGDSLTRSTSKTYTHYHFALYASALEPHQRFFFKILQLPAFLYISQATLEHKVAQYGPLLPRLYFTPLDRNFQQYTYLVRSEHNIISLAAYLQIKKECREPLEIQFFLKCLQFLNRAFKIIQKKGLPIFNISQVGISQTGEFQLCDPSLYFSGHPQTSQDHHFGTWIDQMVREILQLPLDPQMQEEMLRQKLGQHLTMIRPLVQYLKSGEAELQVTQSRLSSAKSRFSEQATTVTGSFADVHELVERNHKENIKARKLSFRKMGKLGNLIVLFVVLSVIAGVGYFCFRFFNRSILCQEGEYLDANKQCLSCFSGCIRCSDSQPQSCQRCDLNMYLVLDDQEDKQGFCLSECRGKLINVGVCVREKTLDKQDRVILKNLVSVQRSDY